MKCLLVVFQMETFSGKTNGLLALKVVFTNKLTNKRMEDEAQLVF